MLTVDPSSVTYHGPLPQSAFSFGKVVGSHRRIPDDRLGDDVRLCEVFGCRPHEGGATRTGPAYANLKRRKPREGIRQTVRRALSKIECRAQFRFVVGGFSKNLGLEYVYNFGVIARVLGEEWKRGVVGRRKMGGEFFGGTREGGLK
jgi:hypothetical protein